MAQHEPGTSGETLDWSSDVMEIPVRDLTGVKVGDYQVERLLGRGGMGQVYLANQLSLNRPVALKVLHPKFLSKPTYLSRFEAEATAVAKLNHPNIVHVYTLGQTEALRFIAMEYVEGMNLRDFIAKKGALDLPLAMSIMRQAGLAIGAAGELGLIHRDIKPENILLTRKGRVKVADFGLCRDLEADRMHVTQPGTTMGTPLYMSPEQAQGRQLDHRSDLYSLGVTFYHMLTGDPPFRAESAVALAMKHLSEPPISLRLRRPEIPVDLERLVLKLMAKDPAERYQSAGEMLADLARVRGAMQLTSATNGEEAALALNRADDDRPGPVSAVGFVSTGETAAHSRTMADRLARPAVLALIAVIFLAAGAAAGWKARTNALAPEGLATRNLPALGLEPGWTAIPRQNSAEDQYRYAQLRASAQDLDAAWVAVPGHFPHSPEWGSPAYLQLARRYYRQGDLDRLTALRDEIAGWPGGKTPDRELAQVIDPAIKLLNQDLDGVIAGMADLAVADDRPRAAGRQELRIFDPGLLEFSAEVVAAAGRLAAQPGTPAGEIKRDKLMNIQGRLVGALRRVRLSEWAGRAGPA